MYCSSEAQSKRKILNSNTEQAIAESKGELVHLKSQFIKNYI